MKFFVLAGGYGKRAEPLSLIKPKPVFPLNGIPLLRLLLEQMHFRYNLTGFINVHHLGGQIVRVADAIGRFHFIHEKKLSGSMVLRQALPHFSEWLLVINGDTFLEIPLPALLAEITDPLVDGVLLVRHDASGKYTRLHCIDDVFLDVAQPSPGPGVMYAGVALFKKRAIEKINDANFFSAILKQQLHFKAVFYDGIWLDSGTAASYWQANWAYQGHVNDVRTNALCENVKIAEQAKIEKTIIWENTRLGANVSLSECIVTANMALDNMSASQRIIHPGGTSPLF